MIQPLVVDESVDYRIVKQLRNAGFTVYAIADEHPSINDRSVLARATSQNALLLTEDKDFGELVFRMKYSHCGILLIRLSDAKGKIPIVIETLKKHYTELINKFSVINDTKLRIKD